MKLAKPIGFAEARFHYVLCSVDVMLLYGGGGGSHFSELAAAAVTSEPIRPIRAIFIGGRTRLVASLLLTDVPVHWPIARQFAADERNGGQLFKQTNQLVRIDK